jgi:hypothetical protein
MAKKASKKKRESSVDSDTPKGLSKFTEFELPVVAAAAEDEGNKVSLPSPDNFVPTSIVTADGVAVSIAPAAAQDTPSTPAEDLVPFHLIQTMPTQSVMVTPGSSAVASAPGGLLREPEPPKEMVRVTKDGAAPPPMRLELVALLSQ